MVWVSEAVLVSEHTPCVETEESIALLTQQLTKSQDTWDKLKISRSQPPKEIIFGLYADVKLPGNVRGITGVIVFTRVALQDKSAASIIMTAPLEGLELRAVNTLSAGQEELESQTKRC